MLKIEGKTFMNIQEAVQWLLDNNCIPFQCTANYLANTEIGLGTIVNPSPAKVRIGSLIFFADSKVSTVVGVTSNGFIVSDQYNDLVDDVVYVSNVAINTSGHLIVTLSDGNIIDAGLIKQVYNFSIDGSQHLIAHYNDGTTTDLGAIFNGNINIAGNLTADSIIENMSGYSFKQNSRYASEISLDFAGAVKNGNKLTLAISGSVTPLTDGNVLNDGAALIGSFSIPQEVANVLFPYANTNVLSYQQILFASAINVNIIKNAVIEKSGAKFISFKFWSGGLVVNTKYYFRSEVTFLLNDNLAS